MPSPTNGYVHILFEDSAATRHAGIALTIQILKFLFFLSYRKVYLLILRG